MMKRREPTSVVACPLRFVGGVPETWGESQKASAAPPPAVPEPVPPEPSPPAFAGALPAAAAALPLSDTVEMDLSQLEGRMEVRNAVVPVGEEWLGWIAPTVMPAAPLLLPCAPAEGIPPLVEAPCAAVPASPGDAADCAGAASCCRWISSCSCCC